MWSVPTVVQAAGKRFYDKKASQTAKIKEYRRWDVSLVVLIVGYTLKIVHTPPQD